MDRRSQNCDSFGGISVLFALYGSLLDGYAWLLGQHRRIRILFRLYDRNIEDVGNLYLCFCP